MILKDVPKGVWTTKEGQKPISVTSFAQIGFCEAIPMLERIGVRGLVTRGMVYGGAWHAAQERAEAEGIATGALKTVSPEEAKALLASGSEVKIGRECVRIAIPHKKILIRGRIDSARLLPNDGFAVEEDKTVANNSDVLLKGQYLLQVLAYARGISSLMGLPEKNGICRLNYFFSDGSTRTDELKVGKKESALLDKSLERFHQIHHGRKPKPSPCGEKCGFCRFSHGCMYCS